MNLQEALVDSGLASIDRGKKKKRATMLFQVESVIVTGAYGREYTSLEKIVADWLDNNRDFVIHATEPMVSTGRYINKKDKNTYAPQADIYYLDRKGILMLIDIGRK